MTTVETVKAYINQLCTEAGVDGEKAFSPDNNAWYFEKGSSTLELFFTSYEISDNSERTFLRCFSPIYPIPLDLPTRQELYHIALEINSRNMGVKIGTLAERGYMYAIGERDIEGMDYTEFVALINDVAFWADHLDELLKSRFGEPESNLN